MPEEALADEADLGGGRVPELQRMLADDLAAEWRAGFQRRQSAFRALVWISSVFYLLLGSALGLSISGQVTLRVAELTVLSAVPTTLLLAAARMVATENRRRVQTDADDADGTATAISDIVREALNALLTRR